MTFYLPAHALVLVAVMTEPRDLEIARVLGWYRIPLRSAPKVIDVDYLAFYQTSAFGESEGQAVRYLAPVRGHELTTRGALLRDEPDHPRANEEYYKIQLGPLLALPQPIKAERWRRVTFLYTTGAYLLRAETLRDLVVPAGDERGLLWSALRERGLQSGGYQAGDLPESALDPALLALLGGMIDFKLGEAQSAYDLND